MGRPLNKGRTAAARGPHIGNKRARAKVDQLTTVADTLRCEVRSTWSHDATNKHCGWRIRRYTSYVRTRCPAMAGDVVSKPVPSVSQARRSCHGFGTVIADNSFIGERRARVAEFEWRDTSFVGERQAPSHVMEAQGSRHQHFHYLRASRMSLCVG